MAREAASCRNVAQRCWNTTAEIVLHPQCLSAARRLKVGWVATKTPRLKVEGSSSTDPSNCTPSTRRLPTPQDFETEGFRKLRASPAFVFIRSTEPYLDVYADFGAAGVAEACADAGFGRVEAVAATGRHYALVAAKDGGRAAFVDRVRRPARGDQAAGHAPQDVGE